MPWKRPKLLASRTTCRDFRPRYNSRRPDDRRVLGEAIVNFSALTASSPRRVRQSNEIAALRALHQFGRLSRAELARKLGLNRSSSGHIIAGLTSSGFVREVVEEQPERRSYARAGRPGIMLQLVPQA